MSDLNSIFIIGRLTADPKLKYSENGTQMMTFSLANNQYSYDKSSQEYKQNTGFYNVVAFGKQCESMGNMLKKGNRIGINGRLQQSQYQTKSGEKRTFVQIIANNIQFLDNKAKEQETV